MPHTKPLPYLLSAVVALAFGGLLWSIRPVQASAPPPAAPGRFQICGESGNIYVLDTATGQVWQELAFRDYHQGGNDSAFYQPKLATSR